MFYTRNNHDNNAAVIESQNAPMLWYVISSNFFDTYI
jgi:hypothetical protein